jgi:SOS-response transcriptional repressor LexA
MTARVPLTARQRVVYEYVAAYIRREGVAPTFDEIAQHFERGLGAMHEIVESIVAKGWLVRNGEPRAARNIALAPEPGDGDLAFVLHKRDADGWQVFPFGASQRADAIALYERLALNWTETYLIRIERGPRDALDRLRAQ